jgi:hypothetical protein
MPIEQLVDKLKQLQHQKTLWLISQAQMAQLLFQLASF